MFFDVGHSSSPSSTVLLLAFLTKNGQTWSENIKSKTPAIALTGVAQLVERCFTKGRVADSVPGQGPSRAWGADSVPGWAHMKGNGSMFLTSMFLFLYVLLPSLPSKINK